MEKNLTLSFPLKQKDVSWIEKKNRLIYLFDRLFYKIIQIVRTL